MIMKIFKPDLQTLGTCSLVTRSFRLAAQSLLGRHISVNDLHRVEECVRLLKNSGFQHVRSLSLGITTRRTVLEKYWNDYLTILKIFASRKCLVRLWLWEVPFFFLQPRQKKMFKDIVLALSCSVTELGLYGCHFSCYEEMVSFVRVFPHCDKLYIQDCVTGDQDSPENSFANFPQHKLSVVDLDITASSAHELLMDPSGFIEDAELDVSSLRKLACDLRSAEESCRIISATSGSPVRELRFSSSYPDGFQGTYTHVSYPPLLTVAKAFITSVSPGWDLESLAIGPMYHEADWVFWEAALKNFPELPHLTKVQITYHYRTPASWNTSCWVSFTSILSNRKMFPRLKLVDVCPTYRSRQLGYRHSDQLLFPFRPLRLSGIKVTHWGEHVRSFFPPGFVLAFNVIFKV